MHSGGFELTKLTYTRLEDSLIRRRGDRSLITGWAWSGRVRRFSNLTDRVGSGRVGSGRVGSGRVGSGRPDPETTREK